MHLERGRAVLEVVLDSNHVRGQLAELAHRDEPDPQLVRDRGGEDEAARFHADDRVDPAVADALQKPVDRGAERRSVLEKRGDVLEEDSWLGEIGDVTDA